MLYLFFPVYNEGPSAGALVRRCSLECSKLHDDFRIVAVDDGSSDDSVAGMLAASEEKLILLRHDTNQGLRKALETGITWLARNTAPEDLVVFMDGDDSHDPSQIPEMVAEVAAGADVVIASRFRRGASVRGVSRFRQLLSGGAAIFGSLLFRIEGVRDYSCGYRMVRAKVLSSAVDRYGGSLFELEGRSFICSSELLLKLASVTSRFAEIPLTLRYDRKMQPSKMPTWTTIRDHFRLWALLRRTAARPSGPR